jgi:hypothetical protein
MTIATTAMALSLALAASGDAPTPPPPPAARVVHGLAYFEIGSERRIPRPDFDPIAYLVGRMPADAFPFVRAQTDTVGDAGANHDLSLRRARSIADEVVAMGASPDRITLFACGEQALAAPTPDNTPEPVNRVAEFSWGSSAPKTPPPGCTLHSYRPAAAQSPRETAG